MARFVSKREQNRKIRDEGRKRFLEAKNTGAWKKKADYGRESLYRDERRALNNIPAPIINYTLEELELRTNCIFEDERVKAIDPYPGEKVYVESSTKNGAIAYVFERRMRFGTMKDNMTLYHEAAHVLTPGDRHGTQFCIVFCNLIEWFENLEAANHMRSWLEV